MIIKSFELNKINISNNKIILFHGMNEGLKKESINKLIRNRKNIQSYDENEIIDNDKNFLEDLFSRSLFENEKILIIKNASDKILKIIKEIHERKIVDILIIINSKNLDKRSKLRSFFEKDKSLISVAFYPDNEQTLSHLASNFFKKKKNTNFDI